MAPLVAVLEAELIASGSATYDGKMIAMNEDSADRQAVLGDFQIAYDFTGDLDATGQIDNLIFADRSDIDDATDQITIPNEAELTGMAGSFDISGLGIAADETTTLLVSTIDGSFVLPDSLNTLSAGPVDVAVQGSLLMVPTGDQLVGGSGLIFIRTEPSPALNVWGGQMYGVKDD